MRGSAEYTTMKGFMDGFIVKGGEEPETLPDESGSDVALSEELADKSDGKEPPKGAKKTNEDDITFDKDVSMVEDEAKKDIADGYVSDTQGEKVSDEESKGYKAFNDMVSKGYVVNAEINQSSSFRDVMKGLRDQGDLTLKELDDSIVTKVMLGSEWKKEEAKIKQQRKGQSSNPTETFAKNDPKNPHGGRGSRSGGSVIPDPPKPKPVGSGASVETVSPPSNTSASVVPNKDTTSLGTRVRMKADALKKQVGDTAKDVSGKWSGLSRGKKAAIIGGGALAAGAAGAGAYALGRKKKEE